MASLVLGVIAVLGSPLFFLLVGPLLGAAAVVTGGLALVEAPAGADRAMAKAGIGLGIAGAAIGLYLAIGVIFFFGPH